MLAPVPGGLTADEVARKAVLTSPAIAARRAEILATVATLEDTLSRFVPNASLSATYTRISRAQIDFGQGGATVGALNEGPLAVAPCPADPAQNCVVDSMGSPVAAAAFGPLQIPLDNWNLTGRVDVPLSDYATRLRPARRGAQAETQAAIHSRDVAKIDAELDARLAYYDWLRAKASVAIAEQSLANATARLEDARVAQSAGVATEADVLRLDGMAATAEVAVASARTFETLAAQSLAVIMGEDERALGVGEDLFGEAPGLAGLESREKATSEAIERRLELRGLERSAEAMDQARKAAAAAYYPRLDGFADLAYANPNTRFFPLTSRWRASWSVGASLSWRLGTFLQARAQVKTAHARQRLVQANRAAVERAVKLEVNAAWAELERARTTVAFTERSLVSTRAAYDERVALYQAGEATTTDIITAEAERLNATLADLNARIDLRTARARLLRAAGRIEPQAVPADEEDRRATRHARSKGEP
jgi:outer membrane protein TolC